MAQADPVRLAVTVGFIGASLIAGYGGYRAMTGTRTPTFAAQVQPPPPTGTPVLSASAPIARGGAITAPDLRAIMVQGDAPAGSFPEPDALVGKVALMDILPGQIVLAGMVSADKSDAGLAVLIPAGKRAIALPINEDVAVSNLLLPGDLVDVLLVLRSGVLPHAGSSEPHPGGASGVPIGLATTADPGDTSETRVLLQAVQVLTMGEHIGQNRPAVPPPDAAGGKPNIPPPRPEASRTLTLALTPQDSETLALGRAIGTLQLALRNPHDTESRPWPAITLQELMGAGAKPQPVAASLDPRRPIELIVGNEHRTIYSLDGISAAVPAAGTRAP